MKIGSVVRIVRNTIVTILVVVFVIVPALLWVTLSLPWTMDKIRNVACEELTNLLGTKVTIQELDFTPFYALSLKDVRVADPIDPKKNILEAGDISAGIDFWNLVRGEIVISYAELIDLNCALRCDSAGSMLNLMPIIERFKPKEDKGPTKFRLAINTVVIRNSTVTYDVGPGGNSDRFDPNHVCISGLRADITLPIVSDSLVKVDLRRLAFNEQSGFSVKSISGNCSVTMTDRGRGKPKDVGVSLGDFRIELPASQIQASGKWSGGRLFETQFLAQLSPNDFGPFFSPLYELDDASVRLQGSVISRSDMLDIDLSGDLPYNSRLNLETDVYGDIDLKQPDKIADIKLHKLDLNISQQLIQAAKSIFPAVPQKITGTNLVLSCSGEATPQEIVLKGFAESAHGKLDFDVNATPSLLSAQHSAVDCKLNFSNIKLAQWLPNLNMIGPINGNLDCTAEITKAKNGNNKWKLALGRCEVNGDFSRQLLKGYTYNNINVVGEYEGDNILATLKINDPNVNLLADLNLGPDASELSLDVADFRPQLLFGNPDPAKVQTMDFDLLLTLDGPIKQPIDSMNAHLAIHDVILEKANGKSLVINAIDIDTRHNNGERQITIDSDVLNATIDGFYSFRDIIPAAKRLFFSAIPGMEQPENTARDVTAHLKLTTQPSKEFLSYFNVPVQALVPVTLDADMNTGDGTARLALDAPYLRQGNKLIENTRLDFSLCPPEDGSTISATKLNVSTLMPAKKSKLNLNLDVHSTPEGEHVTAINWKTKDSDAAYGNFRMRTSLASVLPKFSGIDVDIDPGEVAFSDTVWTIAPSKIRYAADKSLIVEGFHAYHENQSIALDGAASSGEDQTLTLNLADFSLDYLFETLNIPNVTLGGDATGTFHASALFSKTPILSTDNLRVRNISYNDCVFGDADIKSHWNNENQSVVLDADILNNEGLHTFIEGRIGPISEELDLHFMANHVPVTFLKPYMKAFCSSVTGYATGDARLAGTFKDLDITGDVYGENVKMAIDFTGVTYCVSDSVIMRPGKIMLKNLHLTDPFGNTALFSGELTHRYFNDAAFEFRVTDAKNFLCYDVKENSKQPWFGQFYGNGIAKIAGSPGIVDISANMVTAPKTDFNFVLSDMTNASEYTFITFRDKTPPEVLKVLHPEEPDTIPDFLKEIHKEISQPQGPPTNYAMNFNVDITPDASLNIIMDPVGGDKIKSRGTGNVSLSYDSSSEDLKMYGTYNIDEGSYNFTLQDIIRKTFTIEEGSSIAFHGNPYNAMLNIKAHYAVNANLADLDKSFETDKDINRTKVPVHAMLYVTDDMRTPELAFDITFPTLDTDVYRKVRSIVSTEEMMNQQIIYLLALNRFYTPEYVSATRSGELVSVASSTISSRISSMLDALTDKVSIAPSIRSSRGDFTDTEVDVALSSRLLNNRLILNGVFGYRDNSLNNNSFIGDFDIEYLLNRSGTFRLKAYNRFNDQNIYLRQALTTQGVGLTFKFDFDRINLFRRKKK